ncbi:hypothetical protein [Streptomyces sp. NPDC002490]
MPGKTALDSSGNAVWQQTFPANDPPQAVAGFLAGPVATPTTYCTHCS